MIHNQEKSENFYVFSILWGTISSCLILIFIKLGVSSQFIFSIKDIIIYFYAFFIYEIWIYNKKRLYIAVIIIFFLITLIINYLLLNIEYIAPVNNIRQIIAPIIMFYIYTGIQLSEESLKKINKYLYFSIVFIFVFGVFEQTYQLWEKINLSDFFYLKNILVNENGLSYMFYEPMFENRRRMVSVFLDPISLGHFYATLGSYIFYLKNKNKIQKRIFYICVFGLCLCLSKGAILQFIICIFFFNKKFSSLLKLFIIVLFFFILEKTLVNINVSGIIIHINGFISITDSLTFFGNGIGTAGNYSSMFSNQSLKLDIGDSYIGSLIGQIGIFGVSIWIILMCIIIHFSISDRESKKVALKLFFSIFLISILSENTMNVTSFLFPCIIISLCINTNKNSLRL
ncbi:hypothetical protein EZS27_010182 [termite gut metagenome]|uniref:O-antigen ligase domain-containing protein n=1 Tax=termite gut metagenome TaxID=433724 RepID=A0A5J4S7E1_9ZZZZ